jgi:putative flippase GtrA
MRTLVPSPKLKTQLLRFLVVGISAVATDFFCYFALLTFLSHAPAKSISFIAGTIVAYFLNKYWTFAQKIYQHAELGRFIILYTSTLAANVAVNTFSLQLFPELTLLAFLAATSTSTILNFIGQKWWVFKT